MQKHVNLVDLVKSFSPHISLQNLASIQQRTSLSKFVKFSHSYPAQRFDFHIGTTPGAPAPGPSAAARRYDEEADEIKAIRGKEGRRGQREAEARRDDLW